MVGNPITNEVAEKALKKLEAENVSRKGASHPKYAIRHEGRIIASTGLRRASKKDISVPHVKRDLRVAAAFILDLARCPKDKTDWLKQLGILEDDSGEHQ